ncbi:MAG: phage tail protein [Armatimonadota bacterium]|nr:phage tail protein [Armatimonadota bacterium]
MPSRQDPYRNFNFVVEFGGQATAGFHEVVLPAASADVVEYREGGDMLVRKLPGLVKYSNLLLRRGITTSNDLYQWWRTVETGQAERREVMVTLLDEARNPVKRWRLRGAWPVKYQPSSLQAEGRDVAIETLELAVEGMEVE